MSAPADDPGPDDAPGIDLGSTIPVSVRTPGALPPYPRPGSGMRWGSLGHGIPSPRRPEGNHTGWDTRKGALRAAVGRPLPAPHPARSVYARRGDGMTQLRKHAMPQVRRCGTTHR